MPKGKGYPKGLHFGPKDNATTITQKVIDRAIKGVGLDPKKSLGFIDAFKHSKTLDKAMKNADTAVKAHKRQMKGLSLLKGK